MFSPPTALSFYNTKLGKKTEKYPQKMWKTFPFHNVSLNSGETQKNRTVHISKLFPDFHNPGYSQVDISTSAGGEMSSWCSLPLWKTSLFLPCLYISLKKSVDTTRAIGYNL